MPSCESTDGCYNDGRYRCFACGARHCCEEHSAIRAWRSRRGKKWAYRAHRICDECWEEECRLAAEEQSDGS